VCKACFDEGRDTDVPTRRLTGLFVEMKYIGHKQVLTDMNANSTLARTWRDK